MGNLNITLEGYANSVAEFMIKAGYAKTKTEALRLALFEFDQRHHLVPDEELAYELAAKRILGDIENGSQKIRKYNPKALD